MKYRLPFLSFPGEHKNSSCRPLSRPDEEWQRTCRACSRGLAKPPLELLLLRLRNSGICQNCFEPGSELRGQNRSVHLGCRRAAPRSRELSPTTQSIPRHSRFLFKPSEGEAGKQGFHVLQGFMSSGETAHKWIKLTQAGLFRDFAAERFLKAQAL